MTEFVDGVEERHLVSTPPTHVPVALLLLFFLFGLGSWVAINGLFAELPALIVQLPEGPALPAALNLAIQASNAVMLAYVGLR